MRAYERFLKYVRYPTASSETTGRTPSTEGQRLLGQALAEELSSFGFEAECDALGYVYAVIPATPGCERAVPVGFISHMDTSPEFSGEGVVPKVTENYDGGDLVLGEGVVLRCADFPHLPSLKGQTLITASGGTLLGADDKAGVAEIMTLAERLAGGEIPHGKVCIGFTPDEEIGEGADHFDVARFGAVYAYTMDGDTVGGIEYENFNASSAEVEFHGFSVHPGSSKDTMVNASLAAMEFNALLPALDIPRHTDGYRGFIHLCSMEGDVCRARLQYILRDHSAELNRYREELLERAAGQINLKYGEGTVTVRMKEQYRNMAEIVKEHRHIIEKAEAACRKAGVKPFVAPIRGGTDGARLSFMGLPCPNLGTGGHAFHGPYEHITAESMDQATEVLVRLVAEYAAEAEGNE